MPKPQRFPMTAVQRCGWTALARVVQDDGSLAQAAALTAVRALVENAAGEIVFEQTFEPVEVVLASLAGGSAAPDPRWEEDDVGYNFRATLPAAAFEEPGPVVVEFVFEPVVGSPWRLRYEGIVLSRLESAA